MNSYASHDLRASRFGSKWRMALAALAFTASLLPVGGSAQTDSKKLQVVGGDATVGYWVEYEKPFWAETLPAMTGGKLTANGVPYTELGLTGFEMLRQLRSGTYDVVSAVLGSVVQDSPAMEGADLPGISRDTASFRKALDAYRPVIERELQQKYNGKLLAIYPWPSLHIYCNFGDRTNSKVTLDDLKGKKIRTFSTSAGDLIKGLGGVPVTVAFGEVIPALERRSLDCGITSVKGAYLGKWHQVSTHDFDFAVGYASQLIVMNLDVWKNLGAANQQALEKNITVMADKIWANAVKTERDMTQCNGNGPCAFGPAGKMVRVELSAADKDKIARIANDDIVKNWAKRCGTQSCIDDWNNTLGKVTGLKAAK